MQDQRINISVNSASLVLVEFISLFSLIVESTLSAISVAE